MALWLRAGLTILNYERRPMRTRGIFLAITFALGTIAVMVRQTSRGPSETPCKVLVERDRDRRGPDKTVLDPQYKGT